MEFSDFPYIYIYIGNGIIIPTDTKSIIFFRGLGFSHQMGMTMARLRIPIAGKISTMVFDKTGTITHGGRGPRGDDDG